MSTEQRLQTLFQREADKAEIIAALRHALDIQYRRFIQAARADWEKVDAILARVPAVPPEPGDER